MKRLLLLAGFVFALAGAAPARAQAPSAAPTSDPVQPPTVEFDVTAGYSTQGSSALASQLRLFGEGPGGFRYFIEGVGNLRGGSASDAFASAYPYDTGFFLMEAYAEHSFRAGQYLGGVRAGRFRIPFGIYGRGDQAYNGFLRAPLVRSYQAFGLSNLWLEGGGDFLIGTPHLQVEASVGTPSDPVYHRRSGLDTTVRLQGYTGPFIVGASYIRTRPADAYFFATGAAEFHGVDARWMRDGLQLRGEWISGAPFLTAHTDGWYVDAMLHRPFMGRTTAVLRYEELVYDRVPFSFELHRFTAGARVELNRSLYGQVNLIHQSHLTSRGEFALDLALTHTLRK